MIIYRYLTRQVIRSLIAVTLVLLLIFICQQLVRYLSYAASGKITPLAMLEVIGYQVPFLLSLMLPPGLYFAILMTYGRLYADNELRILNACGLSPVKLLAVTAVLATIITLLVTGLTFWVNPHIAAKRQLALLEGAHDSAIETLMSGRFRADAQGKQVIYVEKISRDHKRASNVFVARRSSKNLGQNTSWTVLSADKGYQKIDPVDGGRFLVAENGYRYEGVPGKLDYQIFHFSRYAVRLPDVHIAPSTTIMEAKPTRELINLWPDNLAAAELQWRISIPLTVIMLSLFAVPISRIPPRRSRYVGMLPALIIYLVYMNLLIAGRHMIEQKSISVNFGLWWVHALFLFVISLIILWRTRRA